MTASGDDRVCPAYVPVPGADQGVIVMLHSVPETYSFSQNFGIYCDVKNNDEENR